MTSKRELYSAVTFFALAAVLIVAFHRPLGLVGWASLVASVGFVILGCVALLKRNVAPERRSPRIATARDALAAFEHEPAEVEEPIGEPSAEERDVLERTIAALEAVGALEVGDIEAAALWTATQRLDPGRTVGVHEALGSFYALHDLGRGRIGRLTFVPSHTEYDRELIAEIVASALASLGHDIGPADVAVELPPGGDEGTATISFPLAGRIARVACHYHWKYPPADLLPALAPFYRPDDPRDLVGADPGDQTLLYVAIRSGELAELNRLLPGERDMFGKA